MRQSRHKWVPVLAILGAVSGVGCVKREPLQMPIAKSSCTRTVLSKHASGLKDRSLAPDTWFSMILSNYDPLTKRSAGRPKHCNGEMVAIAPFPADRKCEQEPFLGRMVVKDSDKLNMGRLVREPLNEREELVWLQTHVDENEDALGPVVRVEWGENFVSVHPMGTLAAHRNAAQLRVLGDTQPVLAVESDRCAKGLGRACKRELRVRVLVDGAFKNLPMVGEQKQCLGEFAFELQETKRVGREHQELHRVSRTLRDLPPDGLDIMEEYRIERVGPAVAGGLQLRANRRRRIIVRDDSVFVESGAIEAVEKSYPSSKAGRRRKAR